MISSSLMGKSKGDPEKIIAWAIAKGCDHPKDVALFVNTWYELGDAYGLNADWGVIQSAHETGGWKGRWWLWRKNPAGIGITGTAAQDDVSRFFADGEAAARAQFAHLWLYAQGVDLPGNLEPDEDPRWFNALNATPSRAKIAPTIDKLAGTWAADMKYATGLRKWEKIFTDADLLTSTENGDANVPTPTPVNTNTRTTPLLIAIGSGHRNTRKGGAYQEYEWTPEASRALQRRARARGMIAELIMENDGDSDPNFSTGKDIGPAYAAGINGIIRKHGRAPDVILNMHYNGGNGAGAHFIHVDGWAAPQRKGDNGKDVSTIREICKALGATGTVALMNPTWAGISDPVRGVFSERQSGAVANKPGNRLAEMVYGDKYQSTTTRIIAEAGSIGVQREAAYIRDKRWVEFTYCECLLNGIEKVWGVYRKDGSPNPAPDPDPTPTDPEFDTPIKLAELETFRVAEPSFIPRAVNTPEGWAFYIGEDVIVTEKTPRYQTFLGEGRTGVDLEPGEPFFAAWGLSDKKTGNPYTYTLWGTRVNLLHTDLGVTQ